MDAGVEDERGGSNGVLGGFTFDQCRMDFRNYTLAYYKEEVMKEKHLYCVLCAIELTAWHNATEEERKGHEKPEMVVAKYVFKNMSTCDKHFKGYMENAKAVAENKIVTMDQTAKDQLKKMIEAGGVR